MKKLFYSTRYIIILCVMLMIHVPAFADVAINSSSSFPDSVFRNYINSNFDTDNDGSLSASEIAAVTAIDVSNKDLNFRLNNVLNIDLSRNVNLISVDCVNNYLVRLDVSGMYDFNVVLSDDAEVGEKLIWLANSEDTKNFSLEAFSF